MKKATIRGFQTWEGYGDTKEAAIRDAERKMAKTLARLPKACRARLKASPITNELEYIVDGLLVARRPLSARK